MWEQVLDLLDLNIMSYFYAGTPAVIRACSALIPIEVLLEGYFLCHGVFCDWDGAKTVANIDKIYD